MAKGDHIERLLARLRELEAEALRLEAQCLSHSENSTVKTYAERLDRLNNAHSHSWFGDHASTYFDGFTTPARSFDVEWGFVPGFHGSHNPGWNTYSRKDIRGFVFADCGEEVFYATDKLAKKIIDDFSNVRDQTLDVLELLESNSPSRALTRYKTAIESEIKPFELTEFINGCAKRTPNMTRDSEEIAKGKNVPAHVQYLAPIQSLEINGQRLRDLAVTIRKTIEAMSLNADSQVSTALPNAIFIGHGRSEQWRVLKDFLKERLNLPFEEFNRVSPAGISTQERLGEMLNKCGFAFLVFTAEDIHADQTAHARENVIHEAGLFQGRLGWRRAIVLLEDGCGEFSNIVGLGQIRFSKGNIASCFEEIRRAMERERLL